MREPVTAKDFVGRHGVETFPGVAIESFAKSRLKDPEPSGHSGPRRYLMWAKQLLPKEISATRPRKLPSCRMICPVKSPDSVIGRPFPRVPTEASTISVIKKETRSN